MSETIIQRLYEAWEKTDKDEALAVLHDAAVEITRLYAALAAERELCARVVSDLALCEHDQIMVAAAIRSLPSPPEAS